MEMKRRGMYISRQLSFKNVTSIVEHVPLPTGTHFARLYEISVKLWIKMRKAFNIAADFIGVDEKPRQNMWSKFWSTHSSFFKYLCVSVKVNLD